jgi:ssDNA-binding Zn-finger/Zn-ribbon topoisomerase 1
MKSVKACPSCGQSLEVVTNVHGALLGYFCSDTVSCRWVECQSAEELKWEIAKLDKSIGGKNT